MSLTINGNNIFLGDGEYGIFLSTNNGSSWNSINNGIPKGMSIRTLIIDGSKIYAGGVTSNTGQAVILSTNNGTSWTDVSNGLTGHEVNSLTINGDTMFAGVSNGGVWKRPLSEMVGIQELKNENAELKINPNPINESSVITYQLPEPGMVSLKVYDIMGRDVACNVCLMIDGEQAKGEHTFKYDASGLRSGVYFIRMLTNNGVEVVKFVKD